MPDDVTLLWAEDNWGNVRRLPTAEERKRPGGAGVYYHFDYHGGPRSYQWINTSPIAKIWDQMSLAKQYGADRIWIVNVGHFKGYEFPMEYFLDLAWNTDRWTNENINEYTRLWAEREFGSQYAAEIADIIAKYTKYNGRRKPELLEANTYSLVNYRECGACRRRLQRDRRQGARRFKPRCRSQKQDAFYQLVLFPSQGLGAGERDVSGRGEERACMRHKAAPAPTTWRSSTRDLFQADADLMTHFNNVLAGGKWDHFHGPVAHRLHELARSAGEHHERDPADADQVPPRVGAGCCRRGFAVRLARRARAMPVLPAFDALNQQRQYIDVFNRGRTPFEFTATTERPVDRAQRYAGNGREGRSSLGDHRLEQGAPRLLDGSVTDRRRRSATSPCRVEAFNPPDVTRESLRGFAEGQGLRLDRARTLHQEDRSRRRPGGSGSKITAARSRACGRSSPLDAPGATPGKDSPSLEYRMYLFTPGQVTQPDPLADAELRARPRPCALPFRSTTRRRRSSPSFRPTTSAQNGNRDWEESVRNNARMSRRRTVWHSRGITR